MLVEQFDNVMVIFSDISDTKICDISSFSLISGKTKIWRRDDVTGLASKIFFISGTDHYTNNTLRPPGNISKGSLHIL